MENFYNDENIASLKLVFFSNAFVRALDSYRCRKTKPNGFPEFCDEAISIFDSLRQQETGGINSQVEFLQSADEVALMGSVIKEQFKANTSEEAKKAIERTQNTIINIKSQKEFTDKLEEKIRDLITFFEKLADEGLVISRRQASGEITGAERVWQHYAMS